MNNKQCYYYKYIKQENGIFENTVDAVFVLLMENSKREDSVKNQLSKYNLHSNIIIQYNKGFKSCKKKLIEYKSNYDLLDAYIQVFNYSNKNNYENILVLEDDFIVTKNIYKKDYISAISNFIKNNDYNVFSLGTHCFLKKKKINNYINKCFIYPSAHANIYNKQYFKIFKDLVDKKILRHADQYINVNKLYMVNIPIIIQPYETTENKQNWDIIGLYSHLFLDKLLNINWDKNYKEKELEYWERYYYFFTKVNIYILANIIIIILKIIIIIVVVIIYIISVKSNKLKISSGNL